jgi:ubiquitin-protein ligase
MSKNNAIFDSIASKLTEHTKKDVLIPTYRYINKDKNLYILFLLKHSTEINPFKEMDFYFSITLNENYPNSEPYVRCLSNFCNPTLFDNRNLNSSIINHKYIHKEIDDYFKPIEEIISNLPKFIKKVKENTDNDILIYYGDYIIDDIYDLNDFLVNSQINFFRVEQILKNKSIQRYVVLTEIYFLFFDPAPDSKNLAKLLFIGDIRQLTDRKIKKTESEKQSILCFSYFGKNENEFNFEFLMENELLTEMLNETDKKIKYLQKQYKFFAQNENDVFNENEFENEIENKSINEVNELIDKYKKEIKEKKSLKLLKILKILYKKIETEESLKKIEEIDEEIQQLEKIENSKYLFKVSKSYADEEH